MISKFELNRLSNLFEKGKTTDYSQLFEGRNNKKYYKRVPFFTDTEKEFYIFPTYIDSNNYTTMERIILTIAGTPPPKNLCDYFKELTVKEMYNIVKQTKVPSFKAYLKREIVHREKLSKLDQNEEIIKEFYSNTHENQSILYSFLEKDTARWIYDSDDSKIIDYIKKCIENGVFRGVIQFLLKNKDDVPPVIIPKCLNAFLGRNLIFEREFYKEALGKNIISKKTYENSIRQYTQRTNLKEEEIKKITEFFQKEKEAMEQEGKSQVEINAFLDICESDDIRKILGLPPIEGEQIYRYRFQPDSGPDWKKHMNNALPDYKAGFIIEPNGEIILKIGGMHYMILYNMINKRNDSEILDCYKYARNGGILVISEGDAINAYIPYKCTDEQKETFRKLLNDDRYNFTVVGNNNVSYAYRYTKDPNDTSNYSLKNFDRIELNYDKLCNLVLGEKQPLIKPQSK